jgi:hypothetical protein
MVASRPNSVSTCAPSRKGKPQPCRKRKQRPLHVERLEDRLYLAGDLLVPELSSRPDAAITIYLDFDGHFQAEWGSWSNITSPVFDRDGDPTSFTATELTNITDIWARVAEDFAPFNVNVTTVEPASFGDGEAIRVVIGGGWADWYGTQAGGASFFGSFTNAAPNVAYVFENDLGNGFPRWTAEAISHEAGHMFGLEHQSTWFGDTLQSEYNTGEGDWAPIMGNGNFAQRTTWHNGTTHESPTSFQDELAILGEVLGAVADDYGNDRATAAVMPVEDGNVNLVGLIGHNGDYDVFRFTTAGGDLTFSLSVARIGANLDSVLELWDADGQSIVVANDPYSYGSYLAATVAEGTYFLVVRSTGGYGNLGAYTLLGTVVPGVAAEPEISVLVDGVEFASGGMLSFGSTQVGTPVTRTITITNVGEGDLHLQPLALDDCPPGFTLLEPLDATTLAPGESASFVLQFDASTVGTSVGTLQILSNDGDEGTFELTLEGTAVAPPPPPEPVIKTVDNGNAGFKTTGKWHLLKNKGGFEKDVHFANKFVKKDKQAAFAIWTFTGLEPGEYRVSATWTKSPAHASNAQFIMCGDGTVLGKAVANQKRLPIGFHWAGKRWEDLGTVTIQGNRIVVKLSNRANGKVVADAIRIERIFSTVNAALPQAASGTSTPTADEQPRLSALWLADASRVGSTPHVSTTSSSSRLHDYWHSLASAALTPTPASPADDFLRQHDGSLLELSLLNQTEELLDELAVHLASQDDDAWARG